MGVFEELLPLYIYVHYLVLTVHFFLFIHVFGQIINSDNPYHGQWSKIQRLV